MKIIPAINCGNFECVKEKLQKSAELFSDLPAEALAKEGWVQIDIADGKFTSHKTWNNPKEISNLKSLPDRQAGQISNLNLEIHLMVENPQDVIDDWMKAGAKRIIVHFESLAKAADKNPLNDLSDIFNFILEKSGAKNIEIGLALSPKTPVEEIISYLDKINFIQILAVDPGLAGQKFQPRVLDKIKFLKNLDGKFMDIIIEIDGGINLETAKLCKEAGADILAVASYIWDSQNPKAALEGLSAV